MDTVPSWHAELQELGFKDPLPPPSPIVQATIAGMPASIQQYIQSTDLNTIASTPEDGEPLLLLSLLDLSHWTRVFEFANSDTGKAMARLEEMTSKLHDINDRDALEMDEARGNTAKVEQYLKRVNFGDSSRSGTLSTELKPAAGLDHPFVIYMKIPEAHKAALEDLRDSISSVQTEQE